MTEDRTLITLSKQCPLCHSTFGAGSAICSEDGTLLMPIRKDALIGSLFADKYRVTEEIGRGGMSIVYKGLHELMRRQVAIKIMQRELSEDPSSVRRFQQESEAASRLAHPHVISIYDFGVTPGAQPYMVLDLIKGTTFSDVIKETRGLDPKRALHIFDQICDALDHAHQRGVVHRDLKPSNIMLVSTESEPDYVKVLDFGIAKVVELPGENAKSLTTTGEVFGSPLYMSPEQCKAESSDQRTDVYAIGIMLYEALTGHPPFYGASYIETLQMQISAQPRPFVLISPDRDIPPILEDIAFKAIAKKPDDRYQTVQELRSDLQKASAQLDLIEPRGLSYKDKNQVRVRAELPAKVDKNVQVERNSNRTIVITSIALVALACVGWFGFNQIRLDAEKNTSVSETKSFVRESVTGTIFYYNPDADPGLLVLNNINDGAVKIFTGRNRLEDLLTASHRKVSNGDVWNLAYHRENNKAFLDTGGTTFANEEDEDIRAVDKLIRDHYSNLANGNFDDAYNDFSVLFVQKLKSKQSVIANWRATWRGVKDCKNAPVSAIRILSQNGIGIEARVEASSFVAGETSHYHIQFVKEKSKQAGKHTASWKFHSLSIDDESKIKSNN